MKKILLLTLLVSTGLFAEDNAAKPAVGFCSNLFKQNTAELYHCIGSQLIGPPLSGKDNFYQGVLKK